MQRFKKLVGLYSSSAVIILNMALLVFALNLLLTLFFPPQEDAQNANPVLVEHGKSVMAAYPDLDEQQVQDLLDETWTREWVYAPYVQFQERPIKGTYVSVSAEGFRAVAEQAAWPPPADAFTVFVLGGSTTFGYGVADNETIPSYLQEILREQVDGPVNVYNMGSSGWISLQERLRLTNLLLEGYRPDLAIFVDGLNDFGRVDGDPWFTKQLDTLLEERANAGQADYLNEFAIGRAARALLQKMSPQASGNGAPMSSQEITVQNANQVVDRYLNNMRATRAIASEFGVQTLFVWQPVPMFDHDMKNYPFELRRYPGGSISVTYNGYEALQNRLQESPAPADFLWLADAHAGQDYPMYVDRWHYSARFNQALANRIAARVVSDNPDLAD